MKRICPLLMLLVALWAVEVSAQVTSDTLSSDTLTPKVKKGSIFSGRPGKAMVMSLIIPGTGQIYNKSYLRVPVIWGAVGGMGYLVHYNTQQYNCLKEAYEASIDGVPYDFPDHCKYDGITNSAQLKELRDNANEARQLSIVGLSLVWLANGIDAFVNAHLKSFDVDDDLSVRTGTRIDNDPNAPMRVGFYVQF